MQVWKRNFLFIVTLRYQSALVPTLFTVIHDGSVKASFKFQSKLAFSSLVKAANKFYGQTASPSAAEDIQQRLKELSFAQETSFLHTLEDRKRVAKKRVGTRAAKSAPKVSLGSRGMPLQHKMSCFSDFRLGISDSESDVLGRN